MNDHGLQPSLFPAEPPRWWHSLPLLFAALVVAGGGAWLVVKQPWEPHCVDPHEACAQSDSVSGDHTLPQVLARFGLPAPCGTRGLQYAYSDGWNDDVEIMAIHTAISPACLRAFLAQVAPGFEPRRAKPVLPGDVDFAAEVAPTSFPNGVLGPLDAGHRYAWTELHESDHVSYLAVDIDAATPVLDLRVIFNAPDVWASPGR